MKNISDIILLSQTRLSSARCPRKSIRQFYNTTLTDLVCQKLENISVLPPENIYFAAYEEELKQIVRKYSVNLYERSYESSNSEGDPSLIYEWHKDIKAKYFVLVSCCTPFLKEETIANFVDYFVNCEEESLFSVFEKRTYYWDTDGSLLTEWPTGAEVMDTKLVKPVFEAAHSLYAGRIDLIGDGIWMNKAPYTKNSPKLYVVNENECLDIDYEWQFQAYASLYESLQREVKFS